MVSVLAWKWGTKFSAVHCNVLAEALRRHLHIDHELVVVTNEWQGLDPSIRVIAAPMAYADTPRCRRRMIGFSEYFTRRNLAERVLYCDLDVVITGDLTSLLERREPIIGWKVGHAGVYSGSFLLADNGALDGAFQRFAQDPVGYPTRLQPRGVASDQAMVNAWIETEPPIGTWTEADGFVTYYGKGYERLEHLGVGPRLQHLPAGARIVVLGSDDLDVLAQSRYPWVKEHWTALVPDAMRRAS